MPIQATKTSCCVLGKQICVPVAYICMLREQLFYRELQKVPLEKPKKREKKRWFPPNKALERKTCLETWNTSKINCVSFPGNWKKKGENNIWGCTAEPMKFSQMSTSRTRKNQNKMRQFPPFDGLERKPFEDAPLTLENPSRNWLANRKTIKKKML